ncbi:MAG: hypothetical protein IPJ81_04930 [Chitinophagaceae bacterium]|nr:hypothetical protein [Chitinophagaceae bacterium]
MFTVDLFIIGAIGYFLINFAKKTKLALINESIEDVNHGLKSLKISFIIFGVVNILGLLSALLSIVVMF